MKKVILTAIVALALSSCGSSNYLPCPAYGSVDQAQDDLHALLECENCDEID